MPTAQKAAASRAIYSDIHLELLERIQVLQAEGMPLTDVRRALASHLDVGRVNEIDLVARQTDRTRRAILEAAARQFARNGYRRTRIADIIRDVGISPPVFYHHFQTKRQLFTRSFNVFVSWMEGFIERQLATETDPGLRILSRMRAYFGLQAASENQLWLARFEALHEGGEAREAAQDSLRGIIENIQADLVNFRGEGENGPKGEGEGGPPIPDELVAYSLLGALEISGMRASWDDRYSRRDVMWTHLHIYLALKALLSGRLDISEETARYAGEVERLAALPPPVPPAVLSEDQAAGMVADTDGTHGEV
ncbi:MAG: TetR family transcriptional regulator [Thermoleophilia bacterium]